MDGCNSTGSPCRKHASPISWMWHSVQEMAHLPLPVTQEVRWPQPRIRDPKIRDPHDKGKLEGSTAIGYSSQISNSQSQAFPLFSLFPLFLRIHSNCI